MMPMAPLLSFVSWPKYSMSAVLNLFRLADHLTNFVSVRGPPKKCLHFLEKISDDLLKSFFLIFWFADHQKEFRQFSNFLAFFRVKGRKNIPISIYNLVVTQSMKRHQVLVHNFVRNQLERRWGQFLLNFSHFPIIVTHLCIVGL